MAGVDFDITLQPKQGLAYEHIENSRAKYLLYGGAKFGGKSYLVRGSQLIRRLRYAGTVGLIVRRTYPELLSNHIRKFFTEFPATARWYSAQNKAIMWPNGSVTEFRHLGRTDDVYNFQGIEYDDIDLDEATQHEEEVFQVLKTSLRTDPAIKARHPNYTGKFLLTGNPGGRGHAFVKRLWVDRQFKEDERPEDFNFIQARMEDNPRGVAANPDYAHNLSNLPEHLRKAYRDGDWNIFAGQYFDMLDEKVHLCKPFKVPENWARFRSMDWGYGHNAVVCWWACNPEGRAFIYKHLITNRRTPRQLGRDIVDKSDHTERHIRSLAGGDFWNRTGTNEEDPRETPADLIRKEGVVFSKADSSRVSGWQTTADMLNPDQDGGPRMKIFQTCKPLFEGLQRMVHDEKRPDDCEKIPGDDEADAVRYGAQYLTRGHDMEEGKTPIDRVIDRIERENLKQQQQYEEWGQ